MKILMATGLYPPDIGGPATYTVFLEKHAERLGLTLVVVPFSHVRAYPPILRHALYCMELLWKSRGCDIIYALDTVSVGVPALLASVLTRKPLLLRVPGDYAWEQGQQRYGITETLDEYLAGTDRYPIAVRFMAWLQLRVAQRATHIIVPSEYMKSVVHGWGIDLQKVTRIYSALKSLEVAREERERDTFVITTAARLVPWKGIAALIEAVVALHGEGVPVSLHIIGDGVCRKELEAQVARLDAVPIVHFFGALPRTDLGSRLVASDVFVLNTSYEGLSHQLLEVMNLGVPIITTPVGGNVELVTHEETGLMVPFNDVAALKAAIVRVYENRSFADSLASRAKEAVKKFDETIVVEDFMTLMRSLWKFSH